MDGKGIKTKRQIKVAIIKDKGERNLESKINNFLNSIYENLIDIKYAVSSLEKNGKHETLYSALIVYYTDCKKNFLKK